MGSYRALPGQIVRSNQNFIRCGRPHLLFFGFFFIAVATRLATGDVGTTGRGEDGFAHGEYSGPPSPSEFASPKGVADLLTGRTPAPAPAESALQAPHHSRQLLVRFKPGATQITKQRAHDAFRGSKVLHTYRRQVGLELVQVPEGKVQEALAAYRKDSSVEYAEPDHIITISGIPNDPDFGELWGLQNTGQTVDGDPGTAGADIGAVQAWDIWTGDPTFRIAVIDTGVDYTHPDLVDNIWTNPGEIPDNGIDDDVNGYVDDVHGFNFLMSTGDPMDDNGHGTHVAGTIGAVSNNGIGIAGINWRCQIVGLKFLSSRGSGLTSGAIQAVEYAVANGLRLSNNSWGSTAYSQSLYNAIQDARDADHVFVAAAGNDPVDGDLHPHYPAGYNLGNIISVAATDNDDRLAGFSTYGLVSVDLGAPGVKVYSSIPGGDYAYFRGTSMASPHVTGVVGLLMSRLPALTWSEVRDVAIGTTRPVVALQGKTVSGGVIDAAAAVGDCNRNGILDDQDIAGGTSGDCGMNGVPDECESDCNNNGRADSCDLFLGSSFDCTGNGILDDCEPDCNSNAIADSCELADGSEEDCNRNGIPDSCEPDCNTNGVVDGCDIWLATSLDCTENGIPDECEPDCNGNTWADSCDIDNGVSIDCNGNAVPDECDLASGTSDDCSGNSVPDECEYDCDDNGRADSCDIADGLLPDTDGDGVADVCELGMRLVPISASGPHTIEGNQLRLPAGGQRVTLELRMSGWDTDSDYVPQLRAYQAALDGAAFSNGLNGSLDYARIPCTRNEECRHAAYNPRDACIDGFCDEASAVFVDLAHPDFVYRDNGAIGATFLNIGLPPLFGGVIIDGSPAPPDTGTPRYGATVLLDVPENAEGTFVVSLLIEQAGHVHTFWSESGGSMIPIPLITSVVITLPADCNLNGVEDAEDIAVGTSEDCNTNGVPDECMERESDCNANLHPDECDIADSTSLDVNRNDVPDECEPSILYVNGSASGISDGRSWATAFTNLQDALGIAEASVGSVDEIWVAAGTYRPSLRFSADDARSLTFKLVSGAAIYGGFAGDEAVRAQRDHVANVTILSGDIAGNDGSNFINNSENAYNVVRADGVTDSTTLDGFTITGGNADAGFWNTRYFGRGGGMYTGDGSPTVSNCIFRENIADYGGGLAAGEGSPAFDHCLVTSNVATISGGAYFQGCVNLSVAHCRFVGNTAWSNGGLMVTGASDASLDNCLIAGNIAHSNGGMWSEVSTTRLTNCTIAFNRVTENVYGVGLQHSSTSGRLYLSNSIVWGNEGSEGGGERFELVAASSAVLHHNCVKGWSGLYEGVGNFGDDPLFVDPLGPDSLAGTADDDLRLLPGSSAANTGDNDHVPPSSALDLDGNPRIVNVTVDLGPYEQIDCNANGTPDWDDVGSGQSTDCNGNGMPDECEPDCNLNGVADACDIADGVSTDCDTNGVPDECDPDCNLNGVADACDLTNGTSPDCNANLAPDECDVADGTSGDCDSDGVPDECVLEDVDCNANGSRDACDIVAGTSGDCDANGVPDDCEDCNGNTLADSCDLQNGTSTDLNENGVLDECDFIVYVDETATGAATGTNWTDAFTDLQDALALAADPLSTVTEIWVADGHYKPDRGMGTEALSFELGDGIRLFGGFAGGEARFTDRSPTDFPTVLTGDLAGDDELGFLDRAAFEACYSGEGVLHPPGCQDFDLDGDGDVDFWDEMTALKIIDNSWHVVNVPDQSSGCLLDGFTIRGGNALIGEPYDGGGLINLGSVTIRNCTFEDNWAYSGGGVASIGTSVELIARGCVFRGNYAYFSGGGLSSVYGVTEIHNCTFESNEAENGAGAQFDGGTLVSGSLFVDNRSNRLGGALWVRYSPRIVDTIFDGNSSGFQGGAVHVSYSSNAFTNCLFRRNTSAHGGAVYHYTSNASYVNCVFAGNVATSNGGALLVFNESNPSLVNCTLVGNDAIHGGALNYADPTGGEDGLTITNSVLWGNTSYGDTETQQIRMISGSLYINHSCLEGWSGTLGGIGNFGDDPLLVDADGLDGIIGTKDDDLRLGDGSPCIDAGDNVALPADALDIDGDGDTAEATPIDADGTPRFLDDPLTIDTGVGSAPIVDVGAFEFGDDCNGNGVSDDQDIANGTSEDCSGNAIPDECEPDCNGNALPDSCDIFAGTEQDCNANAVPDACDIGSGRSTDCDASAVPDECELDTDGDTTIDACDGCPTDPGKIEPGACGCGIPDTDSDDDTVADCADICGGFDDRLDADGDGIPDGCDQCDGFDDTLDTDGDAVPDGCDECPTEPALTQPEEVGYEFTCDDAIDNDCDGVADGLDTDCTCQPVAAPAHEPAGVIKNRYISFAGSNPTQPVAIRVTFVALPAPFDVRNGQSMWVAPPVDVTEQSGSVAPDAVGGWSSFQAATLQCDPFYAIWDDLGTIHVHGEAIVPGATFELHAISNGCPTGDEANFSEAMPITTGRWGDLVGSCATTPCHPPDGSVDVPTDVVALLDKFRNLPGSPGKAQCDLEPAVLDMTIGISDIAFVLDAFRGEGYPYLPGAWPCVP